MGAKFEKAPIEKKSGFTTAVIKFKNRPKQHSITARAGQAAADARSLAAGIDLAACSIGRITGRGYAWPTTASRLPAPR